MKALATASITGNAFGAARQAAELDTAFDVPPPLWKPPPLWN
jgi:hypothetical protein